MVAGGGGHWVVRMQAGGAGGKEGGVGTGKEGGGQDGWDLGVACDDVQRGGRVEVGWTWWWLIYIFRVAWRCFWCTGTPEAAGSSQLLDAAIRSMLVLSGHALWQECRGALLVLRVVIEFQVTVEIFFILTAPGLRVGGSLATAPAGILSRHTDARLTLGRHFPQHEAGRAADCQGPRSNSNFIPHSRAPPVVCITIIQPWDGVQDP